MRGSRRSLQMLSPLFAYRERRSGPATAQGPMVPTLSRSAAAASMTPHWPACLLPNLSLRSVEASYEAIQGPACSPIRAGRLHDDHVSAGANLAASLPRTQLECGAVGVMHMSLVLITPM
ncbi:hypothetical protein PG996_007255 [Apiospora saccharicola]|uniref:Uncharacterized protein n=1 Tax=Apiospora saccharicola TaxID=335842 RepID=A0ABR1VAB2_9PEZI